MNDKSLLGKVSLVTGAGRGIGRSIATALGSAGSTVYCVSRTKSELDETVNDIHKAGGKAKALVADVTNFQTVEAAFQNVSKDSDAIDFLVVNAGINADRRSIEDSVIEDWKRTVDVNLFGAYSTIKTALPLLKKRGGRIITIGSGLAEHPMPKLGAYACSKAALRALMQVLAQELSLHNISINEVVPGPVKTSATSGLAQKKSGVFGIEEEWTKEPDDVVPLVMFLATCPAPGPNGQVYNLLRRVL